MLLPTTILLLLAQAVRSAPSSLEEIVNALSEPVSLRMPRTELPPARAVGFMERAWTLWDNKVGLFSPTVFFLSGLSGEEGGQEGRVS